MMTIGLGKLDGATAAHVENRRHGFEPVIRAISGKVLASGKVLCGLAVVENELHQVAAVRAALPENIVAQEESTLALARTLVPRIPFEKFHLLIVDEMGKNISGAGMDTKVIGRGVELPPGQAPEISLIYVRDLTSESGGNSVGVGNADIIHDRLYHKIDFEKMYLNARTALSPTGGRLPIHLASDRENLDLALGTVGSPGPEEQQIVWISNTLNLDRIAISSALARQASSLERWRLSEAACATVFDAAGDLNPIV
jgi:hypothetical protein